jgi:murein endopeptidase
MADFFTYKGYPLVRKGREMYYGNMSDDYVCMLTIMNTKKIKNLEVADKVKVLLMQTAEDADVSEMIVKNSDRNSLYEALEMAHNWLSKTK